MERPETACEDSGRVGGETISERPEEVGNSNRPQGNESPERYSISFRLYIQTIREGRVTGWRETLSGGIVSSLSVPPLYGGETVPLYSSSIPRETACEDGRDPLGYFRITILPIYRDSIRRPHREGGSCVRCARSVSGSLYSLSIPRESPCEDIETPRPSLLDGAYSISFRLYISDQKGGESNRMERDPIRWGRSVLGSPSHPEG